MSFLPAGTLSYKITGNWHWLPEGPKESPGRSSGIAHKLDGGRRLESHAGRQGPTQEGFPGKRRQPPQLPPPTDALTLCLSLRIKWPSSGPMAPDADLQGPGRLGPSRALGGISPLNRKLILVSNLKSTNGHWVMFSLFFLEIWKI